MAEKNSSSFVVDENQENQNKMMNKISSYHIFPLIIYLLLICKVSFSSLETKSIELGKMFVNQQLPGFHRRKPLVCVTFMNASNELAFQNLLNNTIRSNGHCEWAVIIYGGNKETVCNDPRLIPRLTLCEFSKAHERFKDIFLTKQISLSSIPKPLQYFELLPILPTYRYALLMDEDISLQEFDFANYHTILFCSFYPDPPPLISQGLVNEETQDYGFLRPSSWKKRPFIISETVLIEQQMPYFHSIFLQWFIETIIKEAVDQIIETNSAWGADSIWCGAANAFARDLLLYNANTYVPCALIVAPPYYHHLDLKTISLKREDRAEKGLRMNDYYKTNYPRWDGLFKVMYYKEYVPIFHPTIMRREKYIASNCSYP